MYDHRPTTDQAPFAAAPIAIMPQRFEPVVAEALDAIPLSKLPQLTLEGPPHELAASLHAALDAAAIEPGWLALWLARNISFQIRLFGQLTRSPILRLRLDVVTDDGCPRFHTDNVRFRLLCTFRGAGTEWLDPKALWTHVDERPLDPASIRRLDRGAIAFMRGAKDATPERPALVHRSPRWDGTGLARLLLVIDDAA